MFMLNIVNEMLSKWRSDQLMYVLYNILVLRMLMPLLSCQTDENVYKFMDYIQRCGN